MKKIDILIIIICLAASVLSGSAFWNEYSRTLTKLNEEPVGTVSFKKRTAQRKFIDRAVWDMLKQASDVYNGDTIRTINASEAVISFRNETTQITMNANTIIQIFYNDKEGATIDFFGGNIDVNSGAAEVVITSGSSEIVVAGRANLDKKEEGFAVSVMEGEAVLDGEKIETGNLLILDEHGVLQNEKPAIAVTSLNTSTRVTSSPGGITPVVFSWNAFNFNSDTIVIIEISLDPAFKHIVQTASVTGNTSATVNIENSLTGDNYFWRVYPASAGSRESLNAMYPSGSLEIVSVREIAVNTAQVPVIEEIEEVEPQRAQSTQRLIETPVAPTPRVITPEERAKPFIDRGNALRESGNKNNDNADREKAIAQFTEAIRLNPNNAGNYNLRGRTYLEIGDLDRAFADFNKCVQLNPNIADAHAGIANVHLIKGDYNRAIESSEKAVSFEPNNTQYEELLDLARKRAIW